MRLVGVEGEQLGIVKIYDALRQAEEADLDLVEIAPTAQPPVCKIMDYGKFKYQESKKQHEAKLKQKQVQIKEIKFRPGTDEGDYQIKLRNLIKFLEEGDKTKITLRFRGREMAHQEIGMNQLRRVVGRSGRTGGGRAVSQDGRPPVGDDAGAEKEDLRFYETGVSRPDFWVNTPHNTCSRVGEAFHVVGSPGRMR